MSDELPPNPRPTTAGAKVGYLWVPHLPLALARHRRPAAGDHPTIVGDSPTGDGSVVDASDDCLALGVRIGQPLREAREFCPRARFLPAEPAADRQAHEALLDLLETMASAVEDDGLGRAYFAVDPLAAGDAGRLLESLQTLLLTRLGFRARLVLASGRFAARVAAEHDPRSARGTPVVLGDDAAADLAPLPVSVLPLGLQARERLRLLGIATVGQFARLPRDGLPRRFGPEAALAHALARGADPRPIMPRRRPEVRTARREFDPAVETAEPLLALAERLLGQLCQALRGEEQAFRRLEVSVEYEAGSLASKAVSLRQAAARPAQCLTTLRSLVVALGSGGPVVALRVTLAGLAPARAEQLVLFDQAAVAAERREGLDRAVREVRRRYPTSLRRVVACNPPTLLDEYHFALLPHEGGEAGHPLAIHPTSARQVEVVRRGARLYLVEGGRWDELVARDNSWRAEEWWPEERERLYLRMRTRSGRLCTLARGAESWRLVEVFD